MNALAPAVSHEDAEVREFRRDDREAIAYLNAAVEVAFAEDDPELVLTALAVVSKAVGMTRLAKEAGVQRESLHRMLSRRGNPEWYSLFRVLRALRLRLKVEPAAPAAAR